MVVLDHVRTDRPLGLDVGRPVAALADTRAISPEFIGRARSFIARMGAIASAAYPHRKRIVEKAILSAGQRYRTDVLAAIGGRTRRGRPLRPELLIELEQRWRRLPDGNILSRAVNRDRTTFSAADVAIHADVLRHVTWANTEPGVCVMADVLRVLADGSATHDYHVLASLSLHALARHAQKAFRTDDVALFGDVLLLVEAHTKHAEFPVETANGGSWRGEIANVTDSNGIDHADVMHARTFTPGVETGAKDRSYAAHQTPT